MTIFNFNTQSDISGWKTVDDAVMGGVSSSFFKLNNAGFGVFSGRVSLENNGGFCMVQYGFNLLDVFNYSKVCIHLKGDGKPYQFRVKTFGNDSHAYVASFNTSTEWQTIEIPFNTLCPKFRGKTLNMPCYDGKQMALVAFLIGNKKAESFNLEIASIKLK